MHFSTRFLFLLVFGVFCLSTARAGERSGDFEISTAPQNKETSQKTGGDSYWNEKEKSQTLVYKVKITYKGLTKIENVQVKYLVVYWSSNSHREGNSGRSGSQVIKGEEKVEKFTPLNSIEFTTKGIENVYHENNNWEGGKSQWGKAQLKGIAIKVVQDGKTLTEWARPTDIADYWKMEESSPQNESKSGKN